MSDAKDVPPVEAPIVTTDAPKGLSKKGTSAMQGMETTPLNDGSIQDSDKLSRLNKAAEKADAYIPKRGDGGFAQNHEFYEISGRAGEQLAEANTPASVNLNDFFEKSNVPNYDVTSPEGLDSVKVMRPKYGEPRYSIYGHHFRNLINPESHKNQLFAKDLSNLRDSDPEKWQELTKHLPAAVANAGNSTEIAKACADNSVMKISPDQLQRVREDLAARIQQDPQSYGLDATINQDAINILVEKKFQVFDPTITAGDIDTTTAVSMKRRHGKKNLQV